MPAPTSPLPLGQDGAQQVIASAVSSDQPKKRDQLPPDAPGFFPVSLAFNQADAIGGVPAPIDSRPSGSRTTSLGGLIITNAGGGGGQDRANVPNDGDSDGYGQPSPRVTALSAADEVEGGQEVVDAGASGSGAPQSQDAGAGPSTHFKAGYGEVPFPPGQRPRTSASQSPWPDAGPGPGAGAMTRQQSNPPAGGSGPSAVLAKEPPQKLHFEIRVGDPQKVGDPVTAHIVYTVRTKTNATYFRSQNFSVLRRYSDFRWLHAALVANNPGTFVPPVPEKVKIGRFAPDLVEARRHGLEICINKIAAHPILQKDDDFRLFVESINFNADVKLRDMHKGPVPTPEQRTYFGWSASLNGPKFHENDDWFDHQKAYLDSLEGQLKQVVKASSHLAVQRRELSHAVSEYSLMLTNLSGSSLSRSMSTCFAGLGELKKRVQELNESQSDADVRIIGSVMYEYERLVGSIRKAFATRVDAWIAFFKADEDARKAQTKHEKFKKDNRGTGGSHMEHRLQLSHQDVIEADAKALTLKRDFDAITARCKEEMSRFDREKVEDLRRALVRWLDGLIERQEEVVREWELFAALLTRQTGTNPDPDAVPPTAAAAATAAPAPPASAPEAETSGTAAPADAAGPSDTGAAAANDQNNADSVDTEGEGVRSPDISVPTPPVAPSIFSKNEDDAESAFQAVPGDEAEAKADAAVESTDAEEAAEPPTGANEDASDTKASGADADTDGDVLAATTRPQPQAPAAAAGPNISVPGPSEPAKDEEPATDSGEAPQDVSRDVGDDKAAAPSVIAPLDVDPGDVARVVDDEPANPARSVGDSTISDSPHVPEGAGSDVAAPEHQEREADTTDEAVPDTTPSF
ncbi:hypothetical protein V8E36_007836 [Tilletia maclaganii]